MVAGRLSRAGADADRALLQPAGRRAARHPRSPHADMTARLLEVEKLQVAFSTRHGIVEALHGVDIALEPGETLGIVGESGSGKSVTSLAVMRLLDRAGRITGGAVRFKGQDITRLRSGDLRHLRGSAISMIFQNPRAALNPICTVEQQI